MTKRLNDNLRVKDVTNTIGWWNTRMLAHLGVSLLVGVSLLATLAAHSQDDMPAMPPAKVEVATAELREMAPVVEVSGTVISLNDSRIATEVEGVLTWVASVGDAVDKGDVIARMDQSFMQIASKRAWATVRRLEADLKYREQQLKRAGELAASQNVAANFLDESQALRDQAEHLLADARAQLERAELDLNRTRIRAAFAGHITERIASAGEHLGVGDEVVRLVDTHQIEVALPAPMSLTQFVRPGMQVMVKNSRNERLHAVRTIVPVGDAVSRMVEIRLTATDGDWLVGAPVQVSLPGNTAVTTVAVPRDALVERGGESYVFKVNSDDTAERISVSINSTVGLWIGISDGVTPGDEVIIRGAERLTPGQSVEILSAK